MLNPYNVSVYVEIKALHIIGISYTYLLLQQRRIDLSGNWFIHMWNNRVY